MSQRKLPNFLPWKLGDLAVARQRLFRFLLQNENRDHYLMAIAFILLTFGTVQLRHRGFFEQWELQAYDKLLRQQPELTADDRLVLLEVSEEDLRIQETWPFPDQAYATIFANLQKSKPAVIGLDIYRDLPVEPGHTELDEQFQAPNIIAIRNLDIYSGTPAPDAVSPDQIGFNDLPLDGDGVSRRAVLYAAGSDEIALPSFALNIAMSYLYSQEGIVPEPSDIDPQYLKLGASTFFSLTPDSGAYQNIDAQGYQILFQYRDRHQLPKLQTLTFSDALAGNFDPKLVKDKIVLIGSTAPSLKDHFITPFTFATQESKKMDGIVVHGQIISYTKSEK